MTLAVIKRWLCDTCPADGGEADADRTLPLGWSQMSILLGVPMLDSERRNPPVVDLCLRCTITFGQKLHADSDVATRLRGIVGRAKGAT